MAKKVARSPQKKAAMAKKAKATAKQRQNFTRKSIADTAKLAKTRGYVKGTARGDNFGDVNEDTMSGG